MSDAKLIWLINLLDIKYNIINVYIYIYTYTYTYIHKYIYIYKYKFLYIYIYINFEIAYKILIFITTYDTYIKLIYNTYIAHTVQ